MAGRVAHVEELVQDIHTRLLGDKMKGGKDPGLLAIVDQHTTEIYGCDEIGHEGLKPQVKLLADWRKEQRWWIGGVVSVATATIIVVSNWGTIISWFK